MLVVACSVLMPDGMWEGVAKERGTIGSRSRVTKERSGRAAQEEEEDVVALMAELQRAGKEEGARIILLSCWCL